MAIFWNIAELASLDVCGRLTEWPRGIARFFQFMSGLQSSGRFVYISVQRLKDCNMGHGSFIVSPHCDFVNHAGQNVGFYSGAYNVYQCKNGS